jgi:hypothetical protein
MKTKTINTYSFNELSYKAKDKALSKFQYFGDYPWATENRQTLEKFADEFPIKLKNWSYGGRGEGVEFEFKYYGNSNVDELSGNRLRTYLINNHYNLLFERKPYGNYTKNEQTGKWSYKRRSNIFFIEPSCVLTGYCLDESILEPLRNFVNKPDSSNFEELLNDCFNSWVQACNADYEYYYSEESFSEHCEANEYEFDESGNLI